VDTIDELCSPSLAFETIAIEQERERRGLLQGKVFSKVEQAASKLESSKVGHIREASPSTK